MKLFESLDQEIWEDGKGSFAPYYFRYLGYKKNLTAEPSTLRANGIASLFSEPTPVILKSEWIAGNTRSFFCEESKTVLEYAKKTVEMLLQRSFPTNKDHFAPCYDRVLKVGLPGLIGEVDASLLKNGEDPEKKITLLAMKTTLVGFRTMIEKYLAEAEKAKSVQGFDAKRLAFITANLQEIMAGPVHSFGAALQLVWFCHLAFLMEGRYAMALGRLDQYLYPYYKADTERGALTDEEAVELLENVFIRLKGDVVNICIGGQDEKGRCEVNPLSLCILRAVRGCNIPGPNLSLRYTESIPDEFLDECLKTIGTGLGYPAMMNDDVNIAALKQYGYADKDVYNYCMVGCIENFITGMQPPWTDGRFDTPRVFDYVFNHGISETNASVGLDLCDVSDVHSMEELLSLLEKEIDFYAKEYVASFNARNDSINQRYFPEPFLSCFCHDCIGRGLDINNGGSIYPSAHGVGLIGIGTVSDSLAAIEKVVFTDKEATLSELRDALNENFEGYESLREKLLAAPKYGNNDDLADKYAVWFIDVHSRAFKKYKTRDGGGIYIAAATNIDNISAGRVINATPDGRRRGEPISDAASPTYGRDTRGATAAMLSLSKPDYTKIACGSVVNQKYSPSMFSDEKRKKLLTLIRTYFRKGGQEIQINATSRQILTDAMEHPEKYPNLVVRVSGFSAFYVTLRKSVQLDILNRTQQE